MKIDILVRWLPSRIDSVGNYTWNLANALRQSGVDIRLFASAEEQNYKVLAQNEWIFPIIKQWRPRTVVQALKTVTGNTPDWFCFQYVPQMYGHWGICWQVADILWALKKEFRCKIAVTFHEFISSWGLNPKDLFLATITRLQTRRMLSVTDLAITTCGRYRDYLQHISPRSLAVQVIPVGACIEPINISPEAKASFRKQRFPSTAKILGLFSRLSAFRNSPLAVRALQRARQQGLDAWLFIGDVESNSKLFKDLIQLADKLGVKSYIVLSRENLSIALKMVDVFLFPQIDGISTRNTTLMAAMAHGLPVLSFKPQSGNFNGFNIPCGILVDNSDEEGFIQAAVECLNKSDDLSQASQANSDYYYQHFSWPVIAKQYMKVLQDVI